MRGELTSRDAIIACIAKEKATPHRHSAALLKEWLKMLREDDTYFARQ